MGADLDQLRYKSTHIYISHICNIILYIKACDGMRRRWLIAGFFLYLISIFIYFARAMCAIMDIHVHGISPYD